MPKASTTALASNHIQSFELIFPHLLYQLHLQLESQPRLSSAQHLWGDLDRSYTLSLPALRQQEGKCKGMWGEAEPLPELLCQQNKLLDFCGSWRRELKRYFDCLYFVLKHLLNLLRLEPLFQSYKPSFPSSGLDNASMFKNNLMASRTKTGGKYIYV